MPRLIVGGSHGSAAAERGKRPLADGTRLPTLLEVRAAVLLALARCMGGATAGLAGHGRAPSWCTACLLDPWRAASPLDSASDVADGAPLANASLLWMLTAGVRSCRRSKFVVPVGHAPPVLHRLFSGPYPLSSGSTREGLQLSLHHT
jgi:hypothetical protein